MLNKNYWNAVFLFFKGVLGKALVHDGIDIHGDIYYKFKIKEVLSLLQEKSPDGYGTVKENVSSICQSMVDDFVALGDDKAMLTIDIVNQSLIWVAGKIYYESKKIELKRTLLRSGKRPKNKDYGYGKVAA